MTPTEHHGTIAEWVQQTQPIRKTNKHFAIDIKAMADKAIAEFITRIPGIIDKRLEDLLFAGMGFDKSWDKIEVRRADNVINRWIEAESGRAVQEKLKGLDIKITKRMEHAVKKRFIEVYRDHLMAEIVRLAEKQATKDAEKFLIHLVPNIAEIQMKLDPSKTDIHDPEFGKLHLEARILEEMLEQEGEKDEDE